MEVEPKSCIGTRVRMVPGIRAVPQGQYDALPGIHPGRSSADNQMNGTRSATSISRNDVTVSGQCDGQRGAQQSIRGHTWQVPAQQVGRQVVEVVRDLRGDVGAVGAGRHGQIDVDIEPRCGTSATPITRKTPVGCGLDHGQRHGELAHTQPEGQSGVDPVRGRRVHQHSP